MAAPTRRNDPCPCGSGRRYKECHGRLGPEEDVAGLLQRMLAAHQQGRIQEAQRGYEEALRREPGNAIALHYLGMIAWQRGDVVRAERMMREALAADATIADFHNNLGLLLRDTARVDEAIACFRRTLAVDARWFAAHNNLGLALEAGGREDEAIAAYREAITAEPAFAAARQNLARALLVTGRFPEAWHEYRWRLLAHGLSASPPDPAAIPLPAALAGRAFALESEQGLGDVLFFLRFAPELVRRGAALGFRGDARLHGMLARTGLFALGLRAEHEAPTAGERVFVGDLPWLLQANAPERFPAALRLTAQAERVERLRARLAACGPRPWIGLTWRGGVASAGPARTQLKRIGFEALEAALRGVSATWIGVQRLPDAGEYAAASRALDAPVHDLSAANDDLEDMLALQALLDDYVTVSNANVHLRAGTGAPMQVLVPHPPEWRWGIQGARSPWFASARVYRQTARGDWQPAVAALRSAL